MANPNILTTAKPFSKDYQPSKAGIRKRAETNKKNTQKRRELNELLALALEGKIGEEINKVLSQLNIKATTLEEALHFVQIAKAISQKDTQAYMALMQTSGLNKPIKTEHSGEITVKQITGMVIK
jgi:hypothetical protein